MITTRVLPTFFTLLQNALWNQRRPLHETLNADEWRTLFQLADVQTVEGLIMDAVAELPVEQKPPMPIRLQAIARQQRIEQMNEKLNSGLSDMLKRLSERNLQVVLLKGQGVATRYPAPLHRSPGDIDLFAPYDFEAVCSLMCELGATQGKVTPEQHTEYSYNGLSWEIHNRIIDMCHPAARKFVSSLYPREYDYVPINDGMAAVWPPAFDAVYLVAHIVHHVVSEGIGMRQLCDWAMLLHKQHLNIDSDKLIFYLKAMHLERPFKVLGVVAVEKLGLPAVEFPLTFTEKEHNIAKVVWQDILNQGNFGRGSRYVSSSNMIGRLKNYSYTLIRCMRLYRFCPSEAGWRPFMKLVRFFQRGMM